MRGREFNNSRDLQDSGYLRRCQTANLETFYCYVIVFQALAYSLFFNVNFTFCLFKSTYLLPSQAAGTDIVRGAVPDPGSQRPGVVLKSRDFFLVTQRRSVWDLSYPPGKEWWLTSWSGFESETWALVWIFPAACTDHGVMEEEGGGWAVPFCLQLLLFDAHELPAYSQHSRPSLALEICLNTCGVTWIYLHPLGWCPSYSSCGNSLLHRRDGWVCHYCPVVKGQFLAIPESPAGLGVWPCAVMADSIYKFCQEGAQI